MNVGAKKKKRLKEQFINSVNDDETVTEIIRELTTINKTNEFISKQGLEELSRLEAQRARKEKN